MVRHNNDLVGIPDLRGLSKLASEDPDRAGTANVVRHQDIGLNPHIVSSLHPGFSSRPGKYLFRQSHKAR